MSVVVIVRVTVISKLVVFMRNKLYSCARETPFAFCVAIILAKTFEHHFPVMNKVFMDILCKECFICCC